jgi:hypothetical protein
MEIAATKTIVRFAAGTVAVAGIVVISGCSAIGVGGPAPVDPSTSATQTELFPDDLQAACKGATVSRATPYVPAAQTHKVILFSPYGGGVVEDMSTLPEDWMVQFDANSDAYARVDTVACVEVKDEQPGTDDSCPMFVSFDNDTQTKTYYAPPSKDDLVAFIKPFVQP